MVSVHRIQYVWKKIIRPTWEEGAERGCVGKGKREIAGRRSAAAGGITLLLIHYNKGKPYEIRKAPL